MRSKHITSSTEKKCPFCEHSGTPELRSPDGKTVLFRCNKPGASHTWEVRVSTGRRI